MDRPKIINIVKNFLHQEFEVDTDLIHDSAPFKETIGLDSLDYIDLVVIIESHFKVKFTEIDFKNITTFEDFYQTIEHKISLL